MNEQLQVLQKLHSDILSLQGYFTVDKVDVFGHVLARYEANNVVTNMGKNLIVQMLSDSLGYNTGLTYQALGTGGSVLSITVTSPGTGYSSAPTVTFVGGKGAGAMATVNINGLTSITLTDGGTGYTSVPTVTIIGGGGTGAEAQATIENGIVTDIIITNSGGGYTSIPTITVSDPPSGTTAIAVATIATGEVSGVNIIDGGNGYTGTVIATISGGGGTGATALVTTQNGQIQLVLITNGGTGYTSTPTISFVSTDGMDAMANAVISGGGVSNIVIPDGGAGTLYTSVPTISITGGGGTGATAEASLVPTPTARDIALGNEIYRTIVTQRGEPRGNVLSFLTNIPGIRAAYVIQEVGMYGHSTAGIVAGSGVLFSRAALEIDNLEGADLIVSYTLRVT